MQRIFVSHASSELDTKIAVRLSKDLKRAGHEVIVDIGDLRYGEDLIEFMNRGLKASVLIILHSENTPNGVWQEKEINAAIKREAENEDVRIIVLKLDSAELPPLLDTKVYANLDESNYQEVFEQLTNAVIIGDEALNTMNRAIAEESKNPFRRVRAEHFGKQAELLAEAFAPHTAAQVDLLPDSMPSFLEGPRGTGKTMLLMSLRARTLCKRNNGGRALNEVFGFFIRLDRGAFTNHGLKRTMVEEAQLASQINETFGQEFFLTCYESLLKELIWCIQEGALTLDGDKEEAFVTRLTRLVRAKTEPIGEIRRLSDFLDYCALVRDDLAEFVRRKFIYREEAECPLASLDLANFKRLCVLAGQTFPELTDSRLTLLLDEYENLDEYQQELVNTVVKFAAPDLSVKIAWKVGTDRTSATLTEQDLQASNDYNLIPLVYRIDDDQEFNRYMELLESIVAKLLVSEALDPIPLRDLLPVFEEDEVEMADVENEVIRLAKTSREQFEEWSESKKNKKLTYYKEASIYRLLANRRGGRPKRFAGAKTLAFLSTGIIRHFQEILALAYYMARKSNKGNPPSRIEPSIQSEAVHVVSRLYLSNLSRNVKDRGVDLKYFLTDLGDILRHKLLHHSSEPEAGKIGISNPDQLNRESFSAVKEILKVGEREGVFHFPRGRYGMRPKHPNDIQPVEFSVSKIYAPALEISTRYRWRTSLTTNNLRGLLDPTERSVMKSKLIRKVAKMKDAEDQEGLFE